MKQTNISVFIPHYGCTHICSFCNQKTISGHSEPVTEKELEGICQIRGPSPAPLEKSEDFYRWHIWYFCPSVKPVVAAILSLKKKFPMDEDIDDVLDVDPMSLM